MIDDIFVQIMVNMQV